jgi:hypothetical protein
MRIFIFLMLSAIAAACSPAPALAPTSPAPASPPALASLPAAIATAGSAALPASTAAPVPATATLAPAATASPAPTSTPRPAPTQTPAPPTPSLGALLFSDDFSKPTSGWNLNASANNTFSYQKDGFHIVVNRVGAFKGVEPSPYDLTISNFAVQVDYKQIAGANVCSGLFFRGHPVGVAASNEVQWSMYRFDVCPAGSFLVRKIKTNKTPGGNTVEDTEVVKDTPSTAIKKGNEFNRLMVVARGPQFTFYINGIQVGTLTDDSFPDGSVGLKGGSTGPAESLQPIPTEFVYQNFMIWALP